MKETSQKKVTIYTLDYCPYCAKAKMFFDKNNIAYEEIPCENDEDNMRIELQKKFNLDELATFPQITIDNVHIGGYSDLIAKVSNKEIVFD